MGGGYFLYSFIWKYTGLYPYNLLRDDTFPYIFLLPISYLAAEGYKLVSRRSEAIEKSCGFPGLWGRAKLVFIILERSAYGYLVAVLILSFVHVKTSLSLPYLSLVVHMVLMAVFLLAYLLLQLKSERSLRAGKPYFVRVKRKDDGRWITCFVTVTNGFLEKRKFCVAADWSGGGDVPQEEALEFSLDEKGETAVFTIDSLDNNSFPMKFACPESVQMSSKEIRKELRVRLTAPVSPVSK